MLTEHDITVIVDFHSGDGKAVAYGCDLTPPPHNNNPDNPT